MIRKLLVLALGAIVLPVHSMTASVTTPQVPVNTSNVPTGATASKSAPGAPAASAPDARAGAAGAKVVMPSTAGLTQPAAVLAAPGVPARANFAASSRSGGAKVSAKPFMPGVGAQDGTVQAPPAKLAPAAIANDSAGMRRGTLQAVNPGAGTFSVYGQKLNFNAQRVRVFNRDGKPGSIFNLKSGTNVRFTLDATDPLRRRVAVIYVD
ncbi:MAG: hypothetical protein ABI537_03695 [Casimicrobiaceae bacterium]